MPSDRHLAREALAGRIDAAAQLLQRHDAHLRRVARSQGWWPGDACQTVDDLMQDFCVKIYSNRFRALARWKGLVDPGEPGIQPYFSRILRNLMVDRAREWKRLNERETPLDPDDGEQGESADGPDTGVDMRDAVRRCIGRALNERQRRVVMLSLEGLTHAEIAGELGITPQNSRVLLHRAFAALRACLEQGGRNGPGPADVEE